MQPPSVPSLVLIVRQPGREALRVPVGEHPIVLGRGGRSTVRLVDSLVSNEHARVQLVEGEGVTVSDLGSRNGTYVNEKAVLPARGPVAIALGDVVRLGESSARLVLEEPAAGAVTGKLVPEAAVRLPLAQVGALILVLLLSIRSNPSPT
jgi:pSer/pThr/pTyr-binding forkhead associated (FHA) protein